MLLPILESLRPRQWTKNLIVFVPVVFAEQLGHPVAIARAAAAFASFCLLSGAIYLLNDLGDAGHDRLHPTKSNRPIASGRLSRTAARAACAATLVIGLAIAFLLSPGPWTPSASGGRQPSFLATAAGYLLLNVAYSVALKRIVIVDVMTIAMGFVLRAIGGASVIPVDISRWLLICTIFLALFLALAKRRHEILLLAGNARGHRTTLAEYDAPLLDQMIGVVAGCCLISYALYTMAPETVAKFHTDRLSLTIPFVIYGLLRYLYLVHRRSGGGDPSASLINDRPLLGSVVLWGLAVVAILYFGSTF